MLLVWLDLRHGDRGHLRVLPEEREQVQREEVVPTEALAVVLGYQLHVVRSLFERELMECLCMPVGTCSTGE